MRKILLSLFLVAISLTCITMPAHASLISHKSYRAEQKQINKQNIKDIKELLKNLDENKELRVVVSYSNETNEPRVELIKEINKNDD